MIEARGLTKTFQSRRNTVEAVRGVDVSVARGTIVGFLGPNGAGKTTTLRMLTTLLRPTAGEATVAGVDLLHDPRGVRRRIGYVAQAGGTTPAATVEEEMVLQARMHRLGRGEASRQTAALLPDLELDGLQARQVKTLSGGQRRRLDIALGLVHQPELVFLDEPTTGLDPQSRSNLWEHIRRLRDARGTTVFLTTHYLDEADVLCDRILVIDDGRIVAEGTPEELKRRISGDLVTVAVTAGAARAARLLGDLDEVREVSFNADGEPDGAGVVRLTVGRSDRALLDVLRTLDAAGLSSHSLQVSRPTLDDVFLTLTGRSLREAEAA